MARKILVFYRENLKFVSFCSCNVRKFNFSVSERFLTFRPDLWKSAVEISAMSLVTDLPSAFSDNAMSIVGYDMTKLAASNVYTNANIHPDDIDVIELHDCFSANELITYEALGLCAEGTLHSSCPKFNLRNNFFAIDIKRDIGEEIN